MPLHPDSRIKYKGNTGIPALPPNVLVVDSAATGTGDGLSWVNAFTTIVAAIAASSSGNEIWVAGASGAGKTYKPTAGTDRAIYLSPKDGTNIYGGFLGIEAVRSQRNPAVNLTILSGEINTTAAGRSYHVLAWLGDATCDIDSFKVTAGRADNVLDGGGGGFASFGNGQRFINCHFTDCAALSGGAGNLQSVTSTQNLINCLVDNCTAADGGGLQSSGNIILNGTLVTTCVSTNSSAGGVNANGTIQMLNGSLVTDCHSDSGPGGVEGLDVTLTNSGITNCTGVLSGGCSGENVSLINSYVTGCSASQGVGGILASGILSLDATSTVSGNTATGSGGGISGTTVTLAAGAVVSGNTATGGGGGIYGGTVTLAAGAVVSGNTATGNGGGIYATGKLTCSGLVANNQAANNAAWYCGNSSVFSKATVTGNVCTGGSATVCRNGTGSSVINSILWGNTGATLMTSGSTATYTDYQGGKTGTGNINADPLFVSASDFHLQAGSPCKTASDTGGEIGAYAP